MIYKEFHGLKLSALGLGCMRLPTVDGKIDEAKTAEMVDYAMKNGINYYDTAWGYHDGESEKVIGKILNDYPRESYYIATKYPGYDLKFLKDPQTTRETFNRQLEKTQKEYFDFYLIHNVCERNIDAYLDESCGVMDHLLKMKAEGKIRHLGFSAHGRIPVMERFLEKYGQYMEFCQIQLNWLDWDFQDARAKVELLSKYNLPVWVMEPLRGGKLVTLPKKYQDKLDTLKYDRSPVSLGFRFVQSVPEVCVTLSGMSNMEQLSENIKLFEERRPLSENERYMLFEVAREMSRAVPCTSCRYCTTYCPQGLDIPTLLGMYNEEVFSGSGSFLVAMHHAALPDDKKPKSCIGCRSCEAVCPQQIKISETLKDFAGRMKK